MSIEEKDNLATEMLKHQPMTKNPVFEIKPPSFPEVKADTKLEDLVGTRSFLIFSLLKVDYNWLYKPASDWQQNPDFIKANEFVKTAKTVNDVAERAVKLMTDYSKILTTNEEKRQLILQGVAENRRKYKDFRKKTLNK